MKNKIRNEQLKVLLMLTAIGLTSACAPKAKTSAESTAATATPAPTEGGSGGGSSFEELMSSMACRSDSASIDLTDNSAVDARIRALLSDENADNLGVKGHSLIPNPLYDTDGRYSQSGDGSTYPAPIEKRNYLETVKGGRPEKVCGLSGTIQERIDNCALNTNNGAKATYEGTKYGQNGEGDWKLVTLYKQGATEGATCSGGAASGCFEVWRDERTKLIWSDLHDNGGNNYNWFQAAGYSKNATTIPFTYFESAPPAVSGLTYALSCDSDWGNPPTSTTTCQPAHPVSVCADAAVAKAASGLAVDFQNPDGTDPDGINIPDERPNKGNLTGSNPQWRLPTIEDYKLADVNGMRKVLPNMDYSFWSASSFSDGRSDAWYFDGGYGFVGNDRRYGNLGVRCVGRSAW